jgi:hypothetical protein
MAAAGQRGSSRRRGLLALGAGVAALACGRTELDEARPPDARVDAGLVVDARVDAGLVVDARVVADARLVSDGGPDGRAADGPASCSFGEGASEATADDPSLFGTPVYFNGGAPLPAGTYVVSYVDGCMKYSAGQGWTVNAYANGSDGWWLIGASTADKKLVLPGNIGFEVGAGGFASFEDCVAASKAAPPVTFDTVAGPLGIWLQDSPYTDNLAGEGGRNPKWSLVRKGECPPP